MEEAAALALVGAKERRVEVALRIEPGLPPVLADRIQVQQVLFNLMRNALEAMDDGVPLEELNWTGLALAAAAGACWAAYIILSGRTGAEFDQLDGLAIAMAVALVVVLPFGLSTVPLWTATIIATGFGIAMLSSVVPYSLELLALRRLTTSAFGTLMSLEPAFALLVGLVVLGQVPNLLAAAGILCVVAAGVGAERHGARVDPVGEPRVDILTPG